MIDYSLYLCTNSDINKKYNLVECVEQAIIGGVTIVQVRENDKAFEEFVKIAKDIQLVTKKYNVPLIINNNVSVALAIDADGVHLGQDDMTCCEARKMLGDKKIIGITARTLEEAQKAFEDGATYLGVGAMFKSKTKPDAKLVEDGELEKILDNVNLPVVVIGGINENTISHFDNRVSGYAMIRPILGNDDIIKATLDLKKIIQSRRR